MKKFFALSLLAVFMMFGCGSDPNELNTANLQGKWGIKKIKSANYGRTMNMPDGYIHFDQSGKVILDIDLMRISNYAVKYNLEGKELDFSHDIERIAQKLQPKWLIDNFTADEFELHTKKYDIVMYRINSEPIAEEEFAKLYGDNLNWLKRELTEGDMRTICSAIGAYYVDFQEFPEPEFDKMRKALMAGHLPDMPATDAWGNKWVYVTESKNGPNQGYMLISYGADGKEGPGAKPMNELNKDDPDSSNYDIIIYNGSFVRRTK